MTAWLGGAGSVVGMLIPLVGIGVFLALPKLTETNRARRFFLPAFALWFGSRALIGLERGTLVSVPAPLGLTAGALLLAGFVWLSFCGLYEVWLIRDPLT
jgi:hypothetical protein